jgi:hypothetical protein
MSATVNRQSTKSVVLSLTLAEPKKHSGKYTVDGTEKDQWPTYYYLKKEYFGGDLPQKVEMTIRAI